MMFRVENNVPEVYVHESRDFQLFARLYDLVFQSTRFSIDSMERTADTQQCNATLLPLVGTKVGLFDDLNISDITYRKVLSAFPYIIKYKGSQKAIKFIINLFQQLINTEILLENSTDGDIYKLTLVFLDYPPNINLLYALLDYVRPTGLIITHRVDSQLIDKTSADTLLSTRVSKKALSYSGVYDIDNVADPSGHVGFVAVSNDYSNTKEIPNE